MAKRRRTVWARFSDKNKHLTRKEFWLFLKRNLSFIVISLIYHDLKCVNDAKWAIIYDSVSALNVILVCFQSGKININCTYVAIKIINLCIDGMNIHFCLNDDRICISFMFSQTNVFYKTLVKFSAVVVTCQLMF